MNRRNQSILAASALVVVVSAAVGLSSTQREEETTGKDKLELASLTDDADQQACASAATYGKLKRALFEDALKVRSSDSANLDTLATHSVVRMEDPVVDSRNRDLGATSCSGTFILELPPGSERAFGGQRRLAAKINYSARPAADGSGLVYQIDGAEPIIAQLADFNLLGRRYVPPQEREVQFAEAAPQLPQPPALGMGGPEEPVPPEQADRASVIDRSAAEARTQRSEARAAQTARAERARAQREARAERAKEQRLARTERTERARPTGRSARPSFNCRYAKTRSERMVCDSGRLAAHDRRMSAQFYAAMDSADRRTRRELNRSRDRFLAYRDRCRNEACVADAYEGRMREIDDIMTETR